MKEIENVCVIIYFFRTWETTMMYEYIVYNDIAYILQCDATTTHNVDIGSTSIQGLVAVEDQLLGKLYEHVLREHDPQRLCLWIIAYCSVPGWGFTASSSELSVTM